MIHDSGERRQFDTGAVRDVVEGKGRCDLMPLEQVALLFEGAERVIVQLIARKEWEKAAIIVSGYFYQSIAQAMLGVAVHFEEGAKKYDERNWNRMEKSVEFAKEAEESRRKAEYWENKAKEITLAMPESIEYFTYKLEKAVEYHKGLKDGTIPREHAYSLTYANNEVKELKKKVETANVLWGEGGNK